MSSEDLIRELEDVFDRAMEVAEGDEDARRKLLQLGEEVARAFGVSEEVVRSSIMMSLQTVIDDVNKAINEFVNGRDKVLSGVKDVREVDEKTLISLKNLHIDYCGRLGRYASIYFAMRKFDQAITMLLQDMKNVKSLVSFVDMMKDGERLREVRRRDAPFTVRWVQVREERRNCLR